MSVMYHPDRQQEQKLGFPPEVWGSSLDHLSLFLYFFFLISGMTN